MTEVQLQEFKLDPDSELRFEVESKNEKVVLEVSYLYYTASHTFLTQYSVFSVEYVILSSLQ